MRLAHSGHIQPLKWNVSPQQILLKRLVKLSLLHLVLSFDTCLLNCREVQIEQAVKLLLNQILLLLRRQCQNFGVVLVLIIVWSVLLVQVPLCELFQLTGHLDLRRLLHLPCSFSYFRHLILIKPTLALWFACRVSLLPGWLATPRLAFTVGLTALSSHAVIWHASQPFTVFLTTLSLGWQPLHKSRC